MLNIGTLKSFDSANYRAEVQLAGSMAAYLDNIPVARNIASDQMTVGRHVILAIPGGNPKDACVIAVWDGAAGGGGGGGVTDHGALNGLADDDHTQYLKEKASGGLAAEIPDHASNHDWLAADQLEYQNAFIMRSRIFHCDWQVSDYWTKVTNGTGSISIDILNTLLRTGATSGGNAKIYTSALGWKLEKSVLRFMVAPWINPTNQVVWLIFRRGGNSVGDAVEHCGFKIVNGDIYASTGDQNGNHTQEDTGVNTVQWDELSLAMRVPESADKVEYYINDVLKKTFTSNLPRFTYGALVLYIANTANVSQTLRSFSLGYYKNP